MMFKNINSISALAFILDSPFIPDFAIGLSGYDLMAVLHC